MKEEKTEGLTVKNPGKKNQEQQTVPDTILVQRERKGKRDASLCTSSQSSDTEGRHEEKNVLCTYLIMSYKERTLTVDKKITQKNE